MRFGCEQDYEKFCAAELPQRQKFFFPPFCRLVKLIVAGKDEIKTKSRAKEIAKLFREELGKKFPAQQKIFGPIPAAISCWHDVYRFSVLIKSTDLSSVRIFLRAHDLHRRPDIQIDIDPLTTD